MTKNNEDIPEGRVGRGREERGEKEEGSFCTTQKDFCKAVIIETLIVIQV